MLERASEAKPIPSERACPGWRQVGGGAGGKSRRVFTVVRLLVLGGELAEIFPPRLEIAFAWGRGLRCGGGRGWAMEMAGRLDGRAGGGWVDWVDVGGHDGGAGARRGRGTRWVCRSVQSTSSGGATVIEARLGCWTGRPGLWGRDEEKGSVAVGDEQVAMTVSAGKSLGGGVGGLRDSGAGGGLE